MAVDVVPRGRLTVHQTVRGAARTPPSTDEVTRRTVVDATMKGAAECRVAVIAAGGGTANCRIGSAGAEDEVERCHQQGGGSHRQPREEIATSPIGLPVDQIGGPIQEGRHLRRAPTSAAASVKTTYDR